MTIQLYWLLINPRSYRQIFMNTLTAILLTSAMLRGASFAQAPVAPAKSPASPAKLTSKDFRVLPFCREFEHQKFKANDREMPDELRVTTSDRIHLYGKKRGDTVRVTGREIGHAGKVVLLPAVPRSGTLTVNVPTVEEVTHYFAVIEMADESLETKSLKLVKGKKYLWSLKAEGGQTAFRIMADGVEVASLTGGTDSVKGFGFAATVRAKGNEADATVTFD